MNTRVWTLGIPIAVRGMVVCLTVLMPAGAASNEVSLEAMRQAFAHPPASCRPHTRWWWMGNAIGKDDLTWQLQQMHEQGIGGVEQITMEEVYEKGNVPYLSREYLDLVVHAIREARKRGMEFSLNFGGPGWVIGGAWVPQKDRSQNMIPTSVALAGGRRFSGPLPTRIGSVPRTGQARARDVAPEDRLVAVVAGRIVDGRLAEASLVDLTPQVDSRRLEWTVPEGQWRLMAFWLQYTGQGHAVDHFSKPAMQRYCEYLAGKFREAFGDEFGKTVDSFFCDSFEVAMIDNGIYWSDGLIGQFRAFKGYDLTRYLPAIWWDVDEISPKVRYDVNEFLHHVGLDAFFKTFLDCCEANGVQGRIQPYGFATDILQGAGMAHVPEMEITAGEKDAVPWFDTRIGPKKYVSSGAHLYGRSVVTVEAYTYLHWEPYRATLEELKIASDVFLRTGANKFYNHGYTCSPERDIAPSRRFGAEIVISHPNVWWRYYRLLSDYVARCCYLLRQGRFVADVAVYSPLANQWTLDVRNARKWTRSFDWGDLGRLLVANGYDFDLVNDDVLANRVRLDGGVLRIGELEYRVLILPNIRAMPLESLERIREFARGGGVVIALERVPESSVGLVDWRRKDEAVRAIVGEMFDTPVWRRNPTAPRDYGKGKTYHIRYVIDRSDVLERHSSALDPFVNTLRRHVTPDFGIDFVREGLRENDGLAFIHRRLAGADLYFVTNLQDRAVEMPVAFRVRGRSPRRWDPYDGRVTRLWEYEEKDDVTRVPVRLAPYGSSVIVFNDEPNGRHATHGTLARVLRVDDECVAVLASENGEHRVTLDNGVAASIEVDDIPAPYRIDGGWRLALEGKDLPRTEITLSQLRSWTEDPKTRHFSGTGRYETAFELPVCYAPNDLRLRLSLGDVGNIADVRLNGRHVGVIWMRGQDLDVSGVARAGRNQLIVDVTNTLINRVSGLEELPPIPDNLRPRFGGDLGIGGAHAKGLIGYEPLPRSGLLGPVRIRALKQIRIPRSTCRLLRTH
ncbi:MAG: hypothetical protein JXQ73_04785 [Phycisphaerae bacterium]|nr:hypothetical protein [Phycisphaerae bacterium]